jgi:hypothetical protein
MNIANFLIDVFKAIGVGQAFSLVGGMSMHLNRAAGEKVANDLLQS